MPIQQQQINKLQEELISICVPHHIFEIWTDEIVVFILAFHYSIHLQSSIYMDTH